jgi:ABC-type polysaccharide/polyol phosphate transport system ATPase subunit
MSERDVMLDRVWKRYRLGTRRGADTFWALRDVSFTVPRGASFGIIGRNGAGKSTLLKILAGITAPTRGRVTICGRVAPLIEVGSGFHPELTGRENVFLSGSILGMRRREIAGNLASIVEFAGVGSFIDTPVKWYSSGMYVRLGFAIAAHLEPEVLLVDEVLAVGDAEFQLRCLERIRDLRTQGVTIIFISHDLTTVEHLCDEAVLLEKGEIVTSGEPAAVVAMYHRQLVALQSARTGQEASPGETGTGTPVKVTNLVLSGSHGERQIAYRTGEPITVSLKYSAGRSSRGVIFEVSYYSSDGRTLFATASNAERPAEVRPPGGTIEFSCPALPLQPGAYYVGAVIRDGATAHVIDWWDGGTTLYVERGAGTPGQFFIPHTVRLSHATSAETPGAAIRR